MISFAGSEAFRDVACVGRGEYDANAQTRCGPPMRPVIDIVDPLSLPEPSGAAIGRVLSSGLEQATGQHDVDNVGDGSGAGPVALKLAGQRHPTDWLRAGLDDPFETGAVRLG
ncbi:MAG: hypothetical protein QOG22_997 [Pseudonocardiales bacterium]|jgi:hypothetical protein|nr:hypothetical protein [Pseudonocardiales bacterium]